jgi:hypothetical protein
MNKRYGQSRIQMENPEKLTTLDTQYEGRQTTQKNTTQYLT